jgi:hypothetical protein
VIILKRFVMTSLFDGVQNIINPLGFDIIPFGEKDFSSEATSNQEAKVKTIASYFQEFSKVATGKDAISSVVVLAALGVVSYKKPQAVAAATFLYCAYHLFSNIHSSVDRSFKGPNGRPKEMSVWDCANEGNGDSRRNVSQEVVGSGDVSEDESVHGEPAALYSTTTGATSVSGRGNTSPGLRKVYGGGQGEFGVPVTYNH